MKNEEAWRYIKKVADWSGAIDAEQVAQDTLTLLWDEDLPKGYWAACGRNGARRQYRDEQKHIRLREVLSHPRFAQYDEDFYSRMELEYLRDNEPEALKKVLFYITIGADRKWTNQERKCAEHARWKLRALR